MALTISLLGTFAGRPLGVPFGKQPGLGAGMRGSGVTRQRTLVTRQRTLVTRQRTLRTHSASERSLG